MSSLVQKRFLLVITRISAPFDQSFALIAEVFFSEVSAERLQEIYDLPVAEGSTTFKPQGHDIVFDEVSFAYGEEGVLHNVSFTAREGQVIALVIAHRMRTIENADKLVVLQDGKVVEQGSPAQLQAIEGGVYARMRALQQASASWSV